MRVRMYMYFVRVLAADDSERRRCGDVAVVGGVEFVDVPLVFRKDDRLATRKDWVGTQDRDLKGQ